MNETLSQGYAFLAFLYAGILTGVLYDAARLLRLLSQKRVWLHCTDALFLLPFSALILSAFYLVTGGAPRLYGFVCLGLGVMAEQWAFGGLICKRIVKRKR